ncbi:MAG: NUDIX hydrolase [Eubacterium sp.]|nr:NUDIX hydrolase [Eubacterium sp.]
MSYIMDLRKHVGHETLIGVGATTLVFNSKNELLLNLRSDTDTWGIPGGSMELFETIEETAIRELKEETGINANDLELLDVLSSKEYYFEYPNGDKMCSVIVLFLVKSYDGEIKVSDNESKKLKFFSLNNLPALESRAKVIIDKINNGKIKLNRQ